MLSGLLLMSIMLTLASCADDSDTGNANNSADAGIENDGGENGGGDNENEEENNTLEKFTGTIYDAQPFSSGRAWVTDENYGNLNICINEKGEILFKLDGLYDALSAFINGYALIDSIEVGKTASIIDTNGEVVVSSETHGFTDVLDRSETYNYNSKAFKDGYLAVYKEIESFDGLSYQYGVLSNAGEWILELSDEYLPNEKFSAYGYEGGYFYLRSKTTNEYLYWNLDDGSTDVNAPDLSCGDETPDVKDRYPTANEIGVLLSDAKYTYIRFKNESGTYYYSLIDRDGNLKFDPVELTSYTVGFDEDTKRIYAVDYTGKVIIHDTDGNKICEFSVSLGNDNIDKIYCSYDRDDIYLLGWRYNGVYEFVNSDGEKLFQ